MSKSVELEVRIGRLELEVDALKRAVEAQKQQTTATQAELDRVRALRGLI